MFSPHASVQGASAHGPRFQSQDLESGAHVRVYMAQHKDLGCNNQQLKLKSDGNQEGTELQKWQACSSHCVL